MARFTCRRTLRGFEPLEPGALRHVKLGDVVECEVTRPRRNERNRWFWAYITTVHENLSEALAGKYPSPESLVAALKVLTGHAEWFWLPGDPPKQVVRPRSIAFHAMDETAFAEFCERCVQLANRYLLPGVNPTDLRREVDDRANKRIAA